MNLRFAVSVFLVMTSLVLSVGGNFLTRSIETDLLELAQRIEKESENSVQQIETLDHEWKKKENLLSLMLNRREVEQLEEAISHLDALRTSADQEKIAEEAAQLAAMLEDMLSEETFSIYTLF